ESSLIPIPCEDDSVGDSGSWKNLIHHGERGDSPCRFRFEGISMHSSYAALRGGRRRATSAPFAGSRRDLRRGDPEASKIGGVTLQIVRDWVVKFNAHGP